MILTANFSLVEFIKNFTGDLTQGQKSNIQGLAENLQHLRNSLGKPVIINSGIRTVEHNKKVGGVVDSEHLSGKAADIRVPGMDPESVAARIEHLISSGIMSEGGLGIYDTWVHYDTRGNKARWDYRKKKV